jgi:hypothetical protein
MLHFLCVTVPDDDSDRDPDSVKINIVDNQNRTPGCYTVFISTKDGKTISSCCENGISNNPKIKAITHGCEIVTSAESLMVVVKSPGYRTARYTYTRPASGDNVLNVILDNCATEQFSDDYTNVFPEQGGLERFKSMAVKSSGETGTTFTIKFYIEKLDSIPLVYFQNTIRHSLHYNFVRDVLGYPLTLSEFEQQTYSGSNRKAMAGCVIWYSGLTIPGDSVSLPDIESPFTLEFFPSDNLTPDQALRASQLVEERMLFCGCCKSETRLYYLPPTVAHENTLTGYINDFRANGILWMTRETLYRGLTMQLLNAGEAFGTLRRLTPEQLAASAVSYRDIVLLTRLPNELPLVGGTITEELQTPLAHVNVAARSRKTPNMALLTASSQPHITALFDSIVHFKVTEDTFIIEKATLEEATSFWKDRIPSTPKVPASDLQYDTLIPFSKLVFADRVRVGVKAANLAELSRLLQKNAPDGFAVPFFFYDNFLDSGRLTPELCEKARLDCGEEGRDAEICSATALYSASFGQSNVTISEFINSLLANEKFQSDSRFREASLDGLRYIIRHVKVDSSIAMKIDVFADSMFHGRRVRLRSSTNAEDLEDFNGAGLYSSTGADAGGAEKPSSEIRKVWASVWSWQAFEERSFRNIDHHKVFMGVAVHPAFTAESANGVLITSNISNPGMDGFYVNVQPGEVSVTNPQNGSLPEIFTIVGGNVVRQRYSSLSPQTPVMTDIEIRKLYEIASAVQHQFVSLYNKSPFDLSFALELEFKLDAKDRAIFIKQARPFEQY